MTWDWLIILGVFFLASLIRSAFGFGEMLIAVPLLALVLPVQVIVPIGILISITVSGVAVGQDWHDINFRSAGWLTLSTLVGTTLGLWFLTVAPGTLAKAILALVIVAFSIYSLLRQSPAALENDRLAWLFGLGAGVLNGSYGIGGPPVVIYGTLRRWSPQHFRATLQAYFLPSSIFTLCGYWAMGFWTPTVTHYYLAALPGVVVAIFLGRAINQHVTSDAFLTYIHIGLIVAGSMLFVQSLW